MSEICKVNPSDYYGNTEGDTYKALQEVFVNYTSRGYRRDHVIQAMDRAYYDWAKLKEKISEEIYGPGHS